MSDLVLERREQKDETLVFGDNEAAALVSPIVDEDYWEYRVRLTDKQSIVGFPKFYTIGIGFAVEEDDWNLNLPYSCDAAEIAAHIQRNKKVKGDTMAIKKTDVLRAIRLVQDAVRQDRGGDA